MPRRQISKATVMRIRDRARTAKPLTISHVPKLNVILVFRIGRVRHANDRWQNEKYKSQIAKGKDGRVRTRQENRMLEGWLDCFSIFSFPFLKYQMILKIKFPKKVIKR